MKNKAGGPKYKVIANDLLSKIESGEYREGTLLPPIRDLMKSYNCSQATLSHALDILFSRGLLNPIRGKGVFVEPIQASTPSVLDSASNAQADYSNPIWDKICIGVFSDFERAIPGETWWSRIIAGMDAIIRESGGHGQVRMISSNKMTLAKLIPYCKSEGIHALLLLGDSHKDYQLVALGKDARKAGIPIIKTSTSLPGPFPFHLVKTDNQLGVEEAVDHLIQLGHNKIGFLDFDFPYFWGEERKNAFLMSMQAANLEPTAVCAISREPCEMDEVTLTNLTDQASAIVCANDDMAVMLIKWLRAMGKRVPEDYSVVGFDDDPNYRDMDLTTVHEDLIRVGRECVRLFARILESGDDDMRLTLRLPARLVVRQSSGKAN